MAEYTHTAPQPGESANIHNTLGTDETGGISQKKFTDLANLAVGDPIPSGDSYVVPTGRNVDALGTGTKAANTLYWGEPAMYITPIRRFVSVRIRTTTACNVKVGFLLLPEGQPAVLLHEATVLTTVGATTFTAAQLSVPNSVYSHPLVYVMVTNATSADAGFRYYSGTTDSALTVTISTMAHGKSSFTFGYSLTVQNYSSQSDMALVNKVRELETDIDAMTYAVGKSAANNAVQLNEALLSNDYIEIGRGTHEFSSLIVLPSGKSLYGMGPATVLKPSTGLNTLIAVNDTDGVLIANLTLDGGLTTTYTTTNNTIIWQPNEIETYTNRGNKVGLSSYKSSRLVVDKVIFRNWDYCGMRHEYPGATASNDGLVRGITATGLFFENNYAGLIMGERGEYSRLDKISAINNIVGISIRSGNVLVANSHFTNNRIGAHVGTGANDSHGTFSACFFNHNKLRGVYVHGITNGHVFEGCQMFDGIMEVYQSKGFLWNGGIVAGSIIHNSIPSASNRVQNAMFYTPGTYLTGTITESGTGSPLQLRGNFFIDGSAATTINN